MSNLNANAQKWVAALRSGDYTQTQEVLKKDGGFCCMGVACDLFAKENPGEGKWVPITGSTVNITRFLTLSGPSTASMPPEVAKWLGMHLLARTYVNRFGSMELPYPTTLANLNDDKLKTFNEIADIIEVGGLFNA